MKFGIGWSWARDHPGQAAAIITLLVSIILVTALAGTVVTQSDNALKEVENRPKVNQGAAPMFGLLPLMWALMGIAVVAGAVIATLKG